MVDLLVEGCCGEEYQYFVDCWWNCYGVVVQQVWIQCQGDCQGVVVDVDFYVDGYCLGFWQVQQVWYLVVYCQVQQVEGQCGQFDYWCVGDEGLLVFGQCQQDDYQ